MLPLAHVVQCARRNVLMIDLVVFGYVLFEQRLVKRSIANHINNPITNYYIFSLEYAQPLSVIKFRGRASRERKDDFDSITAKLTKKPLKFSTAFFGNV